MNVRLDERRMIRAPAGMHVRRRAKTCCQEITCHSHLGVRERLTGSQNSAETHMSFW